MSTEENHLFFEEGRMNIILIPTEMNHIDKLFCLIKELELNITRLSLQSEERIGNGTSKG